MAWYDVLKFIFVLAVASLIVAGCELKVEICKQRRLRREWAEHDRLVAEQTPVQQVWEDSSKARRGRVLGVLARSRAAA